VTKRYRSTRSRKKLVTNDRQRGSGSQLVTVKMQTGARHAQRNQAEFCEKDEDSSYSMRHKLDRGCVKCWGVILGSRRMDDNAELERPVNSKG
jgi:hypothetical protein